MRHGRRETEAASTAIGYVLTAMGFVLFTLSFALGFLPFVDQAFAAVGLSVVTENSGSLLWLGIASGIVGVAIVVLADVDVEEYE